MQTMPLTERITRARHQQQQALRRGDQAEADMWRRRYDQMLDQLARDRQEQPA